MNSKNKKPTFHAKANARMVESFPRDLFFEILSRLPLKHLIRSQLVCKYWQATMNDHNFTQVLMGRTAFVHHLYNIIDQPDVPDPPKNPGRDTFLFRHGCDGLVLLTNKTDKKHIIWNPATRRILELPDPNKTRIRGFAFSFVPATSSYKLVSFFEESTGALGCEVFTLGQPGITNAWRCLNNFPKTTNRKRERVSVVTSGEAAHCVVVTKDIGGEGVISVEIVSLELGTEEFTVNRVPLEVGWENYWDVDWDGKLGIVEVVGQNIEVLELEDYKKGRWSEKKKIIHLPFLKGKLVPLLVRRGCMWLWLKDWHIFTYTVETEKQTYVGHVRYLSYAEKIYPYKPSLICFQGMVPDIKLGRLRPGALTKLH